MTLSALTWKQLPVQSIAAGSTVPQILDAIYSALTASTYINGATRTPGSGVAWTFSRYQNAGTTEAVYGYPAGSNTMNQKAIFAGSASGGGSSPMMPGCGTFSATTIHAGLGKNTGNFGTWNNATTPFTSGQFSGYAYVFGKQSSLAVQLRTYESQDGILIFFNSTTTAVNNYVLLGGIVDPESSDAGTDAETDGKLYAVATGSTNSGVMAANVGSHGFSNSSAATTAFAHHYKDSFGIIGSGGGSGYSRFDCFIPGSASMLPLARIARWTSVGLSLNSRSNKYVKVPVLLAFGDSFSNYTEPPATFAGRLREIWITRNAVHGTTLRSSGTDLGYFISDSSLTAGSAFMLSC